jgi:pyrroloquinoline-quinone synthase
MTERCSPVSHADFEAWLREAGGLHYHDRHPFHRMMHEGRLSAGQLRAWVANRYYYQTRIPIKDALILSKSEDPAFRRTWVRRIHDHDGVVDDDGGLALWQRLGAAVGIEPKDLTSLRDVLPGVRFACDAYVELVRSGTLLEAVASSLTECFAPSLMTERIAAWERHYPWVNASALDYFRSRVPRARRDSREALDFVLEHAGTFQQQEACVGALVRKAQILWHLLDCVHARHEMELPTRGAVA